MANSRIKWTTEEDKILVQAIKNSPHNKSQAFRKAATKVNHSAKCCASRWYKVLSNPEHKKYVGCMFTLLGAASRFDNRIIYREDVHVTPTKIKKNLWSRIKTLLGLN